MTRSKRLSRKQLALIDDLFKGESDEQKILEKHKVGRHLYYKWLDDEQFAEELNRRVAGAHRQSTFLLARNAGEVAQKLVDLTKSGTGETVRKACLDIITMDPSTGLARTSAARDDETEKPTPISHQAASRVLAVLADDESEQ